MYSTYVKMFLLRLILNKRLDKSDNSVVSVLTIMKEPTPFRLFVGQQKLPLMVFDDNLRSIFG